MKSDPQVQARFRYGPKRSFDEVMRAAFYAGWNAGGDYGLAPTSSISPAAADYVRKNAYEAWRVKFSGALDIAPVRDDVPVADA